MKVLLIFLLLLPVISTAMCRSSKVVYQFHKQTGYPKGRPGYVSDHICALSVGGLDQINNLQWQTIQESLKKDKIERTPLGVKLFCNSNNSKPYRTVFNCN